MPRITTHAIPMETVRRASRPMMDELEVLLKIPREHITLEVCESSFIRDGEIAPSHPFVEVALFDRGAEVEDRLARIITKHFLEAGCASLDLHLNLMERRHYYEDGESF